MRAIREVLVGLFVAVLSSATVLGGIFLAFSETNVATSNSPIQTPDLQSPTAPPPGQLAATAPLPDHSTATAGLPDYSTATARPPDQPTASVCGPPPGWAIYTAQAGDNLFRLGLRHGTTIAAIQQANCLTDISISAGQRLYLPPSAVATDTPTAALPPASTATHTLPAPTATLTATHTHTPTATATSGATATDSATASATVTASSTPSATATPSATDTPTATTIP